MYDIRTNVQMYVCTTIPPSYDHNKKKRDLRFTVLYRYEYLYDLYEYRYCVQRASRIRKFCTPTEVGTLRHGDTCGTSVGSKISPAMRAPRVFQQPTFAYMTAHSTLLLVALVSLFETTLSTMTQCSPAAIVKAGDLGFPFETPDPFLFCVYHRDLYPAGNEKMEAPRRGNGADFDWSAPYRMYHGTTIPGFPQHPHRGFETLTATLEGIIDHTDSLGNAGRYGGGDLQWMTAGEGIVHGENFPLINQDRPNYTKFFQIWLNLPSQKKMVPPDFVMHWNKDIPKVKKDGVTVHVWAGELEGKRGLTPTTHSWAATEGNDVSVLAFELDPGKQIYVPEANGGNRTNRSLYFVEGEGMECNGRTFSKKIHLTMDASQPFEIKNIGITDKLLVLMLQGKPIAEPVAQHGPFVMNTQQEIQQAFADYRRTQFGGWPWPEDAVVFPRKKSRFALLNGKETYPPEAYAAETRVEIFGLTGAAQHNGKTGKIVSYAGATGRYKVVLDESGRELAVKEDNLKEI